MRVPLRRTLFQIWLLPLFFILPGVLNLLLYGLPVTDDTLAHLWRIARMHDSIRAAMLFPRWFPDMLLGFGYPVLTYYASSTYYLVEILNLAGFGLQNALIALYCLLMWFACVGMVLLARDIYPRQSSWTAIVAGVAYAYTPYLLINLYVRGALAEFGLQALLPWLFWSFRRIWRAENPFHYLIVSALTLGGLAFTHTISLLIVPPLLLAYNIVLAMAASKRQVRLKCAFVAIVGAMGISCFFWGPLFVERNYITNRGLTIAKTFMLPANFHSWGTLIDPHFLYAYFNQIPWKLGLIQTSAAIVGLLFFIWQSRKLVARDEWWFWLGTATLCVSLMVEVAKPLWLSNDVMPIIQFPWRFLAILQLPIALLTALPLTTIGYRPARAIVATALGVLLIVVHLPRIDLDYLDPRSSHFNMGVHAYFDASEDKLIQGERFAPGAQEFRPRWTEQTLRLDPDSAGEASPSQQATSQRHFQHIARARSRCWPPIRTISKWRLRIHNLIRCACKATSFRVGVYVWMERRRWQPIPQPIWGC